MFVLKLSGIQNLFLYHEQNDNYKIKFNDRNKVDDKIARELDGGFLSAQCSFKFCLLIIPSSHVIPCFFTALKFSPKIKCFIS